MSLSSTHLHAISDLLGDDRSPMETILANLRQTVSNKAELFVFCSALNVLLSDGLLISPLRKVVAYYLIAASHGSSIETSPFFPVFLAVLENKASDRWEVAYCASFLDGLPKDIGAKTAMQVYRWTLSLQVPAFDIPNLVAAYEASFSVPDPYTAVGHTSTLHILDPSQSTSEQISKLYAERIAMNSFMLDRVKPFVLRPIPPLLEPSRDEAVWLNPSIPIAPPSSATTQALWFEWDYTMGRLAPNEMSEAIELLNLSLTTTLNRDQLNKLLTELQCTPEILREVPLTPQALGRVVEKNPKVAIQALVELVQAFELEITLTDGTTHQTEDYLMILNNIPPTKKAMEVVATIITVIELPDEYMQLFLSNCIASCKEPTDPVEQVRTVAMVCVFISTLVRNKLLNVTDISSELEAFCIGYSKVPGAANLYRLLKQLRS